MDKQEADKAFSEAIALQQGGKLDEARSLYEQVLAAFPGYVHAPHLLGVIVSQKGDWFLARRLMETSLLTFPRDADCIANLAWVLYNLGRPADSLARCEQALAIDPIHVRAVLTRAMALRGLGRLDEAIAGFDRALQLRPALAEAFNGKGLCLQQMGRYEDALQCHLQALQLNPQSAEELNNCGACLDRMGRPEEATAAFQDALALRPRFPEALFNLGLLRQKADLPEEALGLFEQALQLNPNYPEALMHRAFALQTLRRSPQDCLASLDRALQLRPDYLEALNGRANILGQLEQYAEALENYDRALQLKPDFHEVHTNRGHALRELGRLDEAAASYRAALRHGGHSESGLYALAALGEEAAPPIAPADYIVTLFDRYADRFDSHLVGKLQYQAHERLCEVLLPLKPAGACEVLDLGCGTGLCGPLLKPIARRMAGVDLSPKMLDAARKREVYDELACADVADYLDAQPTASFDVVVSTDVFIYIGDLQRVFAGVRRAIRADGLFGFSIEGCDDGEDFVLRPSRRYAQSPAYIRRLAAEHGFGVLGIQPTTLRKEQGEDTAGFLAVLRPLDA